MKRSTAPTLTVEEHAPPVSQPQTLAEWRDWLCDQEMPIFSSTARRISATFDDARAGATELAQIVMADPNLSAKVLKLVNSAYYNTARQHIDSLTKAIILLGYDTLSEMALTASYIESIQSARKRYNANREVIDALHAAVQAKSLAQLTHDPAPEEVFLAALLYNVGHVAFRCFEDDLGNEIDRLVYLEKISEAEAEKRVLGFPLRELSAALAKAWHFKGLIEEVHQSKPRNMARARLVHRAHEIVRLQKRGELDADQVRIVMEPLRQYIRKPPAEMLRLFEQNTRITGNIAKQYGVEHARELLKPADEMDGPPPFLFMPEPTATEETAETEAPQPVPMEIEAPATPQPSPQTAHRLLLLQIQQDISNHMEGDFDLNRLLAMVVEGIQRGLPADRALFALLNRKRDLLREKAAVGWPNASDRLPIRVSVTEPDQIPNILSYAMQGSGAVWIRPDDGPKWQKLYTPAIESQFGRHECFIAPLAVTSRAIGIMYADRALSGAPLDQTAFDDFCHLVLQATFGLKLSRVHG
ncbi:MAG: HDOD domain-containing protein [Methylococcaceae bacterium]|nr:MAG: HDOD domain-containing protein [Methylococcaceae bacterium]